MKALLRFLATGICLAIAGHSAFAAPPTYPNRPIKLVVAYPAGGGTDTTARIVADRMGQLLGQSIVIENRPGAAGTIGANLVAAAPSDGYTLLFASAPELSVASIGIKNLPYDPVKDFRPISMVGSVSFVLVANKDFPPNTVAELIQYAKQHPGEVSFASFGNFTSNHLVGELFAYRSGIKLLHVPYKGSAPALLDVMAGRVPISFDSMPNVLPLIEAGKLKPLAIATAQRSASLPKVPTMTESGSPDFIASTWFGLLAPKGTPDAIVDKLQAVMADILKHPDTLKRFATYQIVPQSSTPQGFAAFIASEKSKWEDLAARINLEPQ